MKKYTTTTSVRQGLLAGRHFFVFVVNEGVNHNDPIKTIITHLKEEIFPEVEEGYEFESVVWSNKFKGFLVQVQMPMDF